MHGAIRQAFAKLHVHSIEESSQQKEAKTALPIGVRKEVSTPENKASMFSSLPSTSTPSSTHSVTKEISALFQRNKS